jgi:hypothetical protein
MKKYSVCVVCKEYRWVEVEAEDEYLARDMAWDDIENIVNKDAEDHDVEVYVEQEEKANGN